MEEDDNSVTMVDVLKEQEAFEENAKAVLGASDDKNCTYAMGYVKRQALYACLTCCPESVDDPACRSGLCLACSLACHENHTLIELYTKRNFRCDCGGPKFKSKLCTFNGHKIDSNTQNQYNQNFSGLYCICHRPYPDPEETIEDEMIQCIVCEDWFHSRHLETKLPPPDQYSEMICQTCMDKNDFLNDYLCYEVLNGKEIDQDASIELNVSENIQGSKSVHSVDSLNLGDSTAESIANKDSIADKDSTEVEMSKNNFLKCAEQNDSTQEQATNVTNILEIDNSVITLSGSHPITSLGNEISEKSSNQLVSSQSKIECENKNIVSDEVLNNNINDNSKVEEATSNISEINPYSEIKNVSSEVTVNDHVQECEVAGEKYLIMSRPKAVELMEVDSSSVVNNDEKKTDLKEMFGNYEKSQEAISSNFYEGGIHLAQNIIRESGDKPHLQNSGERIMEVDEKLEPYQQTELLEKYQKLHKLENESNIQAQNPPEDNVNIDNIEQDVNMEISIEKDDTITVDNSSENITDDTVQKYTNVKVVESEESAIEKSVDMNPMCDDVIQKDITTERNVDNITKEFIDSAPEKDIENLTSMHIDNSLEKLIDNASAELENVTDEIVDNVTEKLKNDNDEVVDATENIENASDEVDNATETVEISNKVVDKATEIVENTTDEVVENSTEKVENACDRVVDSATEKVDIVINEIVDNATEKIVDNTIEKNVHNMTEEVVYNTPTESVENVVSNLNENYISSLTKIDISDAIEKVDTISEPNNPPEEAMNNTTEVHNSSENNPDNANRKDINSVSERDVDNISKICSTSDGVVDMVSENTSCVDSNEQDCVHADVLNDNINRKESKNDAGVEMELDSKEHDEMNINSVTTVSTMNLETMNNDFEQSMEANECIKNQLASEESIKAGHFSEHLKYDKCDTTVSDLAIPEESTKPDSKNVESTDPCCVQNTSQSLANTENSNNTSNCLENKLVTPSEDDAAYDHSNESIEQENNIKISDKMEESLGHVSDINLESKSKDNSSDHKSLCGMIEEKSSPECAVHTSEQNSLLIKEIQTNSNINSENITTPQIDTNGGACDTSFDNKKRKHDVDSSCSNNIMKKIKIKEEVSLQVCIKPVTCQKPKRKGAAFWPSDWRSKLCSCSCCLDIYNEKRVSFLLDMEDTVSAYEDLGKIKTEASSSQYEKGMEALSSLGHVQQINAITEYNKMKEKLLEFLKTFKDKKEVVKEEDIKGFFAGMKPKREPDGVYFCQ